jgi:hypothetical protein
VLAFPWAGKRAKQNRKETLSLGNPFFPGCCEYIFSASSKKCIQILDKTSSIVFLNTKTIILARDLEAKFMLAEIRLTD